MVYIVLLGAVLLLFVIGPRVIVGLIMAAVTCGLLYFIMSLFSGGSGSHGNSSRESDPGDGWHGTGNPHL